MDSMIYAAARALAAGDPFGALNRVALRDDAAALALRGIAMAQLGDLERARLLLRRAAKAFGPREAVARARCVVAEAEIALVTRDLGWPVKALEAAQATLARYGDIVNAAHARHLAARRLPAHRTAGRRGARHRRSRRVGVSACVESRVRARRRGHRPSPAAHASGARRTRARDDRGEGRRNPVALGRGGTGVGRARDAGGATHRRRRRATALARGRRGASSASEALIVDACRNAVRQSGELDIRSRHDRCSSPSRARSAKHGPTTSRVMCSSRARSARNTSTSRTARACASRSGGFASRSAGSPTFARRSEGSRSCRTTRARSSCWRGPSMRNMHRCSRCSTTARRGRPRRSRSRSEPVSAPSSAHWRRSRRDGKVQPFGRGRARRWIMPPVSGFTTALLLPAALPIE